MERTIKFYPAWDKRSPDPNKNYGIHGVEMKWILKGELGAIQFVVYTNWQLRHVQRELENRSMLHLLPMPADVGYHSPKPMYEGQEITREQCDILGGKCYYDGSGLHAEEVFEILKTKGDDGVWQELERIFVQRFGKLA